MSWHGASDLRHDFGEQNPERPSRPRFLLRPDWLPWRTGPGDSYSKVRKTKFELHWDIFGWENEKLVVGFLIF